MKLITLAAAVALALLHAATAADGGRDYAATARDDAASSPAARRQLTWSLFPYIPDAAGDGLKGVVAFVKQRYEAVYPAVELVHWWQPPSFNLYDPGNITAALATVVNVLEIDSILLPQVAATGALQPQALDWTVPWHPAGVQAATWNGTVWGTPHWLCTHAVLSPNRSVSSIASYAGLAQHVVDTGYNNAVGLAADFSSTWALPSRAVDACIDSYVPNAGSNSVAAPPPEVYEKCYSPPEFNWSLQPPVLPFLADVLQLCTNIAACVWQGVTCPSACINGTFADDYTAAVAFAKRQAGVYIGYTELLHTIRSLNPTLPVFAASAAMGTTTRPMVFTDINVISAASCTQASGCQDDAHALISLLSSLGVYEHIMLSYDAPSGTMPRYLLPPRTDAFWDIPGVFNDTYYRQLQGVIPTNNTYPFPADTFFDGLHTFGAALGKALATPAPLAGGEVQSAEPAAAVEEMGLDAGAGASAGSGAVAEGPHHHPYHEQQHAPAAAEAAA